MKTYRGINIVESPYVPEGTIIVAPDIYKSILATHRDFNGMKLDLGEKMLMITNAMRKTND